MKHTLLLSTTFLIGITGLQQSFAQSKKVKVSQRPNIIFILADDLGYGDLSCYGQKKFETPHIDRLAQSGMRFTQCYSGTTVSAPSRSCLLTGTHSGHTAIRGNVERSPEGQFPLPADTRTIFHLFKEAGYRTSVFGKWGLGFIDSTGDPNKQGVDLFYGYNCQLLAHNYYPDHLWENNQRIELKDNASAVYGNGTYSQDLIHTKALSYLDTMSGDEPFFLFYPTILPHAELIVPEDSIIQKFRGKYPETPYKGANRTHMNLSKGSYCSQSQPHATFAAMVYRLDVYVGQLVQKLKEKGVYDNTIIIFASDNGPHLEGGADPEFFDSNGIWRGFKRDLYEGGIRIPMIISWPGHIQSHTETDFMCSFWDMMPTFAALLNPKASSSKEMDGISLLPLLENRKGQKEHAYLYFEFQEQNGRQAVRKGAWKLVHLNIRGDKPYYELYNLTTDPSEQHNVSAQYPKKAEELKKLMKEARTDNPSWPLF